MCHIEPVVQSDIQLTPGCNACIEVQECTTLGTCQTRCSISCLPQCNFSPVCPLSAMDLEDTSSNNNTCAQCLIPNAQDQHPVLLRRQCLGSSCKAQCFGICGDGVVVDGVEECDDGNLKDGDGCSTNCVIEEESRKVIDFVVSGSTINANGQPFIIKGLSWSGFGA